ncbi:hypothetical protein CWS43_09900 [Rahnella sp. AA]|uniref:hypothetical protein n=1 Tax=Rahnella sp. AA TaxID=2057180 RepID=UPI000C344361|nr:hypothetical protein [Rahnella sp. AA]PKE30983.1 hypothetical protein CWS43_09900 [Rahnella sp. AA]
MSIQNTIALLEWYRPRNVAAVRTPSGIVFMGARNLKPNEKKTLLEIPQSELDAAIRWQK